MHLHHVISICVWISVALATQDLATLIEEELASSPLIQHLLARVDVLETQGMKQAKEIQTLKAEMTQQTGNMLKLRSNLQAKDRIIQTLIHEKRKTYKDENSTGEESKHYDSEETPVSDAPAEGRRQIRGDANRIRRAENEVVVAFSAGLSQRLLHVGDKQNIVFDQVITNVGNGYNPHHGVFVAPVPGVYVFSTSILSYDSRNNYGHITVNGIQKSLLYLANENHDMSSQTLVFELNQGDDVAIQGHAGDAYYGSVLPYTTFSGFLLQQNFTSVGNIIG